MQPAQCLLLLCFAAAIDSGSSSKAAVPLSQAAERATVRIHLVLLPPFAYDMCHVHRLLLSLLLFVFELNDTWYLVRCLFLRVSTSTYIYPLSYANYAPVVPGITYQVLKISRAIMAIVTYTRVLTMTAQRQQQQSSIAILAGSREGSSTCTTYIVLWRYHFRRLLLPVSSYEYHYRMHNIRTIRTTIIIVLFLAWLLCDV